MATEAKIQLIAKVESEIEARRSEDDRLRNNDGPSGVQPKEDAVDENRDETNVSPAFSKSSMREESFEETIVLWEQPVDENKSGPKKVAIGREKRSYVEGSPRRSINVNAPPDMACTSPTPSCESEEPSVASTEAAPDPPSPRSPVGLFEHLLRPFGSPVSKPESRPPSPRQTNGFLERLLTPLSSPEEQSVASSEAAPNSPSPHSPVGLSGLSEHLLRLRPFGSPRSTPELRPISPQQTNGFPEHLLIPLSSPGSQAEYSMSETELLARELDDRELKIQKLEETISLDTRIMRKMESTIERLTVELLAARRFEQLLQTLGSRCSSLEDEVEELRVENTRLQIDSQMLKEEKSRMEKEMRTELELLHLETGRHKFF